MNQSSNENPSKGIFNWLVIIAALGYFVDIYDLVLFNVVKRESLEYIKALHGLDFDLKTKGIFLFNCQMAGMLIGGILWGIWGDKRGRISVLFGSIMLYSAANIINAFTFDLTSYAIVRVIAGIGLAGELGAGITLVSETMHKEKRGYGTMIIVTFGALGAVLAALVGTEGHYVAAFLSNVTGYTFQNWQVVYLIGGFLGLLLLILRVGAFESGMFKSMQHHAVSKGDFLSIFKTRANTFKYINCILIGLPIWYIIGVLVSLSQDVFGKELGISGIVNGKAVMYTYLGLSIGDLISGLLSQLLRSRRKVVFIYLTFSTALVLYFVFGAYGISVSAYYFLCFLLGLASGYWAIFVTIASEQFGTNIRSTVTNTVPNFVRGAVLPITYSFTFLSGYTTNLTGALVVGLVCIALSWIATYNIKESFAKDLNYFETL
ncbi:MAG TPA: MFS transporter [Bacteroidia bacterium]|nr:MFS transporter [Bacteroidia bacterium]